MSQTPSDGRNTVPQAGCLSGYPDGTYQGSRPVTRYEESCWLEYVPESAKSTYSR
ncbi:MAG: S-layer homology domain-containing protein [Nostoc sp. DedQUE02]|nr:S-layer homology domain-containing protein [Nostoc sp. DedQUE02]